MRIRYVIPGLCVLAATTSLISVLSYNQMVTAENQTELLANRIYQQDSVIYDLRDNNAKLARKLDNLVETSDAQTIALSRLNEKIEMIKPKTKVRRRT